MDNKFEGISIKNTKKLSTKYLAFTRSYCYNIANVTYKNHKLIITYYTVSNINKRVNNPYKEIIINNKHQWFLNGKLQTKKPYLNQLKANIIIETKEGNYVESLGEPLNHPKIREFLNKEYNIINSSIYLHYTLQQILNNCKKVARKSYLDEIKPYFRDQRSCYKIDSTLIFQNNWYIAFLTPDNISYYRKSDGIKVSHVDLRIYDNEYFWIDSININKKTLNYINYCRNNGLEKLISNYYYSCRDIITKLSLNKKKILNDFDPSAIFNMRYLKEITNLNSYRDEDFKILLQAFKLVYYDTSFVIKNYKKIVQHYSEYKNDYGFNWVINDYFRLYNLCKSYFTNNHFPKFPSLKEISKYHDDLSRFHQLILTKQKEKDLENQQNIYDTLLPSLSKLEFSNEKYSIIVPKKLIEIIQEGLNLHHCVGSYIDAICNKYNKIYFLRKNESLNQSWFTIDVDYDNNVRQVHTKYNKTINSVPEYDEIKEFLNLWVNKKNLILNNINHILCHY